MLVKTAELKNYSGNPITINAINVAYLTPTDDQNCIICFIGNADHEIVIGMPYEEAKQKLFG